jgi:hypothetical protein
VAIPATPEQERVVLVEDKRLAGDRSGGYFEDDPSWHTVFSVLDERRP